MSAPDEFDPHIERLFNRPPAMADADAFARRVEQRLGAGARLRAFALGAAGLVGGVIAVRETVTANFVVDLDETSSSATRVVDGGMGAATRQTQDFVQTSLADFGLGALNLGGDALVGAQLFWGVAALLIAGATMVAMRVAQDV